MYTVTSLDAAAIAPEELNGIMADYLAVERIRIVRRLLVTRFGLLVAFPAAAGALQWLTPFVSWFSIGAFCVPPVWAWIVELQRVKQLARRLDRLPRGVTERCLPGSDR